MDIVHKYTFNGKHRLDLHLFFNEFGKKIKEFRIKSKDKVHFNYRANELKAEIILLVAYDRTERK